MLLVFNNNKKTQLLFNFRQCKVLGFLVLLFVSEPYKTQEEAQGSLLRVLRDGGAAGAREVAQGGITSVSQVYTVYLRMICLSIWLGSEVRHVDPRVSVTLGKLSFRRVTAGSVRKEDEGRMTTAMQAARPAGSCLEGKGTEGILNLTRKRIKYASWQHLTRFKAHSLRWNPYPWPRI